MELLTYSRLRKRLNCPFAEHLRYDRGLTRRASSTPRLLGSAVHKGLETGSMEEALAVFDAVQPMTQEEQNALDVDMAICRAMLGGAKEAFLPMAALQPEMAFKLPIINPVTSASSRSFALAGKVDGICTLGGETWLVEYKTAATIDRQYLARLRLDGQITLYLYAMRRFLGTPIAGAVYRIIRKPSIRQTQKESLTEYCNRLTADYQRRPEFYFHEEQLYRSEDDLRLFEQELWGISQRILWERKRGIHPRNTARCADFGSCEYMPLCLQEAGHEALYELRDAHEELKGEFDRGTVTNDKNAS